MPIKTGVLLSVASVSLLGLHINTKVDLFEYEGDQGVIHKPLVTTEEAPLFVLEKTDIDMDKELDAIITPSMKTNDWEKRFTPQPVTPPDITRGNAEKTELSITFDGGSDANDTELILKTLRERGMKTTIFLTGQFIKQYPALVREMVRDGHEIGNHTMTHPHLTQYEINRTQRMLLSVTKEFFLNELKATEELFNEVTGVEMAPFWRAPYGEVNRELLSWALEAGYIHVGWTSNHRMRESLDTLDWVTDESSKNYRTSLEIKERVVNFQKNSTGLNGGIILMHLSTDRTSDKASARLGEMLDEITKRGYRFVKVSALVEGNGSLKPFLPDTRQFAMGEKD